ncbi:hypothetical protein B0A55_06064 [Friedmanniomyces simplex]|uniref:F-box domain-containing protein n=1 Tax=Friedmanniomyces simplex TaxID=329884 RepID=A0A4U0X9J6_9PEZI|nr:hypothetical protein B0A55_06064 [Friedmanniomyces simplex]
MKNGEAVEQQRQSETNPGGNGRVDGTTTPAAAIPPNGFRLPLPGLPAELRNNIYEFASLADTPFQLKPRCKVQQARHLLTTCPLILTNHEVAEEYYAVLAKLSITDPHIKLLARVTDFNFRHLIRFLTTEISAPQLAEAGAAKRLIIELTITAVGSINPERYSDWVNFCQKRGVSAGYTVNNAASGVTFDSSDLMAWEGLGRADRETMKICCALRDWRQFRNWRGALGFDACYLIGWSGDVVNGSFRLDGESAEARLGSVEGALR